MHTEDVAFDCMSDDDLAMLFLQHNIALRDVESLLEVSKESRVRSIGRLFEEESILWEAKGFLLKVPGVQRRRSLLAQLHAADDVILIRMVKLLCVDCTPDVLCDRHNEYSP